MTTESVMMVKAGLTAGLLFIVELLGGASGWLYALCIMILLDLATGFLSATVNKCVQASVMFNGGIKKVLIFVMIILSAQMGAVLQLSWLRDAVIAYYAINEALSILENMVRAGIKVPDFLVQLLKNAGELTERRKKDGGNLEQ